jgi:hypothetical protein
MLISAPGSLVKVAKKMNFCIKNITFYNFKKLTAQLLRLIFVVMRVGYLSFKKKKNLEW